MGEPKGVDAWRSSAVRMDIARALLAVDHELTAAELEEPTGRPNGQSNLRKQANELVAIGLVSRLEPEQRANRVGRPPKDAFALSSEQRAVAMEAVGVAEPAIRQDSTSAMPADDGTVGLLDDRQELVIVDVSGALLSRVFTALATADETPGPVWTAHCGEELIFAFEGANALRDATRLLAILDGARIPTRSAPVRRVVAFSEFAKDAQWAARAAQRVRLQSDTREGFAG